MLFELPMRPCVCGEPLSVSPEGFTMRHRVDKPCYVRPHDHRFLTVWNTIKGWDIQRTRDDGYARATGDDVCAILEDLETLD